MGQQPRGVVELDRSFTVLRHWPRLKEAAADIEKEGTMCLSSLRRALTTHKGVNGKFYFYRDELLIGDEDEHTDGE